MSREDCEASPPRPRPGSTVVVGVSAADFKNAAQCPGVLLWSEQCMICLLPPVPPGHTCMATRDITSFTAYDRSHRIWTRQPQCCSHQPSSGIVGQYLGALKLKKESLVAGVELPSSEWAAESLGLQLQMELTCDSHHP